MKIGFIGCGNMASAMIGGILRQGIFSKDEIIVSNLTEEGRARSEKTLGVVTTLDNNEIVRSAKTVVLAVKPQFYEEVLTEVHDSLTTEHTIIGIAPGKTLAWLEEKAGLPLKVVRFMPNTPAQPDLHRVHHVHREQRLSHRPQPAQVGRARRMAHGLRGYG